MTTGIDFSDYSDLAEEGGYDVKPQIAPENEFFHAIYISGQERESTVGGVKEMPGKLQIRGLMTNLDEINMVIVHVKQVLVKTVSSKDFRGKNVDKTECFSYQVGNPPWKSTSGNMCAKNAAERSANPFCSACRSQIILAGIFLDPQTGKPFMVNDKPTYIFLRGKGVKYSNIANYLTDLVKRDDLEPIVTPVTNESKEFERRQVNHKRFVTKITVGKQPSKFGIKDVFELSAVSKLSVDAVKNILNKQKETTEEFKNKFDWSRGKENTNSGYVQPQADSSQKFNFDTDEKKKEEPKADNSNTNKTSNNKASEFNFDDVVF